MIELKKLRGKIDKIDFTILKALKERLQIASQIAKIKSSKKIQQYDAEREKEILKTLLKKNKKKFPEESLKLIYQEIISTSRSSYRPLTIAYLGPEATFTHLALIKKFGQSNILKPMFSIKEVFMEVEKQRTDYGVVPIENSTEGIVNYTLDVFIDSDLKICDEILLEIHQHLMANCKFSQIKKIYSHPQAIAQCRYWLESNIPSVQITEVQSTSKAAQIAAKEKNAAAIASELAAKIYKLKIITKRIEDTKDNITRFLVIGKNFGQSTGSDKTSIMFSIKDKVGALYEVLSIFKTQGINLTKIESRPSKIKPWEYFFFIDIEGHSEERKVKAALSKLNNYCTFFKILGSYPKGS